MDTNDRYIGRILDNRYEILEMIGVGGMAYVYKALCHRLNRLVAIKILKEDLADDEEFQRRFYTESQAVAMLSHPNIVAVYDVSRSGSTEYIVMELIEGITLKQYINRKGILNWKEVLHFTTQIMKGLSHAHSRGIVHRDVKPHNIMILKDGSVKVADFGIARLASVQNTLTQETIGSVHYISPEQAKGAQIDARSDIYSVGVVMYEMLTSRLPFVGDSPVSVAIQHISAIPLLPRDINPEIPIGLEEITMHAMDPDVEMRFATAEEMLFDLEEFKKNPSVVFRYAMSDHSDRQPTEISAPYETRVIPREPYVDPLNPIDKSRKRKPDISSNDYRKSKTRSGSTAMLVGVLVALIIIAALVVVLINWLSPFVGGQGESVVIPNLIGRRLVDVLNDNELAETFRFTHEERNSEEHPVGIIIDQSPAPDRTREQTLHGLITISLIVSSGETPPAEMPDLRGLHWVDARNRLLSMHMDLHIDFEIVEDEEDRGIVLETIPAYRSTISRGDTVLIRYSEGIETANVRVPELVGSTERSVLDAFDDAGLIADPIRRDYNEVHAEGIVYFIQSAGDLVVVGSRLAIHVSNGPRQPPTPDPTPEPPDPPPPDLPPEPEPPPEPPETDQP